MTSIYYNESSVLFGIQEFSTKKDAKALTHTIQPLSRVTVENAEKTGKTEAKEVTCDILAICDSLNKLCEALSRLDYVLERKNIEISLTKRSV